MSKTLFPSLIDFNPFSSAVQQAFAPLISSYQADVNYAGNPAIERAVVTDIASFGKQLGILSDAVLELAGHQKGPQVEKLRRLVQEVNELKQRRKASAEREAKDALDSLKELDPDALSRLLRGYRDE